MKKFILLFILVLASFSVTAGELCTEEKYVRFGGWSYHFIDRDNGEDWNESHDSVGLGCDQFSILIFKNSFGKTSTAYIMETPKKELSRTTTISWNIGLANGYSDATDIGIIPFVAPKIEHKITKSFRVETMITPVVVTLNFKTVF